MILEGDDLERHQNLLKSLDGVSSWPEVALKSSDEAEVFPPADADAVEDAQERLSLVFPEDLRAFYSETDGVRMCCGSSTVMSVDELLRENLAMRDRGMFADQYMPFDNLLFIGQAGNGDLWAYGILANGTVSDINIYGWDHETDARPWVASGLRDLLMRVGLELLIDAANA